MGYRKQPARRPIERQLPLRYGQKLQQLEEDDQNLAQELRKARTALVEILSEHDDEMVEKYLEADEDHLLISSTDVTESIRRCTLRHPQQIVPVFAGASFRNVGVQPLLDAVADLLPSPHVRPDPEISFGGSVRGGLTELLSGKLSVTTAAFIRAGKTLSKDKAPFAFQNLEACALAFKVVAESGQTHLAGMGELHLEIARDRLINDLKAKARIGNIEIGYRESITIASAEMNEMFDRDVGGKSSKAGCTALVSPSTGEEQGTASTRAHISNMPDNNRLIVSTPSLRADGWSFDTEQPGLPSHLPLQTVLQAFQNGISAALARGPSHGYAVHSTDIKVIFEPSTHVCPNTTPAALSSAARLAVQRALQDSATASETLMMEPVMLVTISVDEDSMGSVVHDISSARGGNVVSLGSDDDSSVVERSAIDVSRIYAPPDPFAGGHAAANAATGGSALRQIVTRVPLKEMVGYLKHLRSLTGGRGTFTMAVDRFERMSTQRQRAVLNEMRGDYT